MNPFLGKERENRWMLILITVVALSSAFVDSWGDVPGAAQQENMNISESDLSSIGVCGSTDTKTQQIVQKSLEAAGIKCFFSGSVVYDILVVSAKKNAATLVLTKEPKLNGAWIELRNSETGRLEKRADSKPVQRKGDRHL
jgi:Flp pilus assembly CpaE family ATPase